VMGGFQIRWGALAMAAFTVMAAFLSHRYWAMPDAAAAANRIRFYKDLAIAGGFLFLHVAGGGRFGADGRRSAVLAGGRA
jgi:putative oxidoreductase